MQKTNLIKDIKELRNEITGTYVNMKILLKMYQKSNTIDNIINNDPNSLHKSRQKVIKKLPKRKYV